MAKISTAKANALRDLHSRDTRMANGRRMWHTYGPSMKSQTLVSLNREGLIKINERNSMLIQITDAGQRELRAHEVSINPGLAKER